MYTIDRNTYDSWTSLSDLLEGENPCWEIKDQDKEIEVMIQQNKLLKSIKERLAFGNIKEAYSTCDNSLNCEISASKNRSTSNSSKESRSF